MDHMDHRSGSRSQAGTRLSLRHDVSNIVCNCNKGTSVPLNKPGGMALFVASSRDTNTDEIKHLTKHSPNTLTKHSMYSKDSHSASHLGNTNPCMDDFDIDSYVHINCTWNQNVKAYNILNEVRASQLAWVWVVSLIYIGRLVPSQYLSKVQLCCLNLVWGELPNLEYIIVLQLF